MQDFRQQVANLQEKNLDKVMSTADQPIGLMIDLIHLSCSFTENSIRSFPAKGRQSQHQQSPIAKINFVRCHQKTKTKRNQRKRSIREQTIGREYRWNNSTETGQSGQCYRRANRWKYINRGAQMHRNFAGYLRNVCRVQRFGKKYRHRWWLRLYEIWFCGQGKRVEKCVWRRVRTIVVKVFFFNNIVKRWNNSCTLPKL